MTPIHSSRFQLLRCDVQSHVRAGQLVFSSCGPHATRRVTYVRTSAPHCEEVAAAASTISSISSPNLIRRPCSSPCAGKDSRCHNIEALLQNIVGFPRMPVKLCRRLHTITSSLKTMEDLLLNMVDTFGREMTWHMLSKAPMLLDLKYSVLNSRYNALAEWLGFPHSEMLLILRKNPYILCIAHDTLRGRFESLQGLTQYTNEQMLALVRKCPLVVNWHSETLESKVVALKSLASNRELWEDEVEYLTPSLLAFFLRDANDLLHRLEYLILTGQSPQVSLRDVFKISNNLFGRKHKGFRSWQSERKRRQQQQGGGPYSVAGTATEQEAWDDAHEMEE